MSQQDNKDITQLKLIKQIRKLSGTNKKKTLLRLVSMPLLKATYNPYIRYNIRVSTDTKGKGTKLLSKQAAVLLHALNKRTLSGHNAIIEVKKYTESLSPESAELFKMVLNKTMDFGLNVKSINQVFPKLIPVHKVMLAKLFKEERLRLPCYGSLKVDGVRGEYNNINFYSRNGHTYKGLQHLTKVLKGFPPLDGELDVPGETFQKASGMIRSDADTPNAVFNVFDLPDSPLPFLERYMILQDLIVNIPQVSLIKHIILTSIEEVYTYYDMCIKMGYEGAVIKNIRHKYSNNRSWNWMKMKPNNSIDTLVLGLFEGKGKYENALGGVIINYKGIKVKVGSGFTDSQRYAFWEKPAALLRRMIEVQYMEETDDGSLRHPVFKGLRPDKEE